MRYLSLLLTPLFFLLQGCSTYMGPNGVPQSSLNPAAGAVLETALSSGMGVATGALMGNSPGWATGGVSGAVGSAGTQLVTALLQGARGQGVPYGVSPGYYQGGAQPLPASYQRASTGWGQPAYSPQYPQYPAGGQYRGGYSY